MKRRKQWPGPLPPSLRFALVSRSMATCRPSSNIGLCGACNRIDILVNLKERNDASCGRLSVFDFGLAQTDRSRLERRSASLWRCSISSSVRREKNLDACFYRFEPPADANIGLMKAVNKFEYRRGYKFADLRNLA